MFTIGLVVNPFAGIGGSVALKGSDGQVIREEALRRGAEQLAMKKAELALTALKESLGQSEVELKIITASGDMGSNSAVAAGFNTEVIYSANNPSTAEDTKAFIQHLVERKIDLILFAGGDGTARDIFATLKRDIPVIGIPAGCKIHSGVYAVTPQAAGLLTGQILKGELLSLKSATVMDIDEDAFRDGKVKARNFGYMTVPDSLQYVQATKQGGQESEELVLADIAADVIEQMEPEHYYVIGSGTTCAAIMEDLNLPNTLLGVDVIKNNELILQDATAKDLMELTEQQQPITIIVTLIGGQGHILGRGNQQLSPAFIKSIGWDNVWVVATKSKLKALDGRPLIVDTADAEFDASLAGSKRVITGYHDSVLYRVGLSSN